MTDMFFKLFGGIGLFLMGMVMLTDGLKAFAGDSLRVALLRFTGRPAKAFAAGCAVTMLVQSSSATTVAVIGFVSAGLISFPNAVGIVMGASLGTTATGWIVSVLGLKVSVGLYALPLVGVGAFMNLLGRDRWRPAGVALAGFGLIFIGIETLQEAMQSLASVFDFASMPSSGLLGHALMVVVGVVMTLVMQSSSAAVATTLTALHTGSINFDQAASIVIGAAIGTTVTGALAAVGGTVPAKRTAAAHILFNLATGVIALLLLPVLLAGIRWAQEHAGLDAGATSLAAFHTLFIALGVVVFLPFADRFAARIERLLPDRGRSLTRHLDPSLLTVPGVAVEATRRVLVDTAVETLANLRELITTGGGAANRATRDALANALAETREFFARIPAAGGGSARPETREAQIHAMEHLMRLQAFLDPPETMRRVIRHDRLQPELQACGRLLEGAEAGLRSGWGGGWVAMIEAEARALSELRRNDRPVLLRETAGGRWSPGDSLELLDAMRWLDSAGYHAWRISNYLAGDASQEGPNPEGHSHPAEA
jgi:phosphate:Na+ symporter